MAGAPKNEKRISEELKSTYEIENTMHKPIVIIVIIKCSQIFVQSLRLCNRLGSKNTKAQCKNIFGSAFTMHTDYARKY